MALYSRLFKYGPRPGRTQLENFVTESLCDCLERMTALDRKSIERFVVEVLVCSRIPPAFGERLTNAKTLQWKTQHAFYFAGSRGCLDLCLLADREIILVIENKVAARFTAHLISRDADEVGNNEGREELSQLEYYGKWLSARHPGAALILLTHLTDAPSTFFSEESSEAVAPTASVFHRVCRWATVYEWLGRWREVTATHFGSKPQGVFLNLLTNEFLEFLEQNNMNATAIKNDDLDLLNAYFSQDVWKKVRDLMASARALVMPLLADAYGEPRSVPETEAWEQTQILWDWAYCHEEELEWYVGWGLSSGRGLRHLDIEFATPLQAFVVVTNDGGPRIPVFAEDVQTLEKLAGLFTNPEQKIN
jgi:hypothetical protein